MGDSLRDSLRDSPRPLAERVNHFAGRARPITLRGIPCHQRLLNGTIRHFAFSRRSEQRFIWFLSDQLAGGFAVHCSAIFTAQGLKNERPVIVHDRRAA